MKKSVFIAALALAGFAYKSSDAQVRFHIGVNFGSPIYRQPVAAAVEDVQYADGDDYYYLPDVDAYYDISNQLYFFMDGDRWVSAPYLPGRYHDFDWRYARHYEVRGHRPFMRNDFYRERFNGFAGGNPDWRMHDNRFNHGDFGPNGGGYVPNRGGFDMNRDGYAHRDGGYNRPAPNYGGPDRGNRGAFNGYSGQEPQNMGGRNQGGNFGQSSNQNNGDFSGRNTDQGQGRSSGYGNRGQNNGGQGGYQNGGQNNNGGQGNGGYNRGQGGQNAQPSNNQGGHGFNGGGAPQHLAGNFGGGRENGMFRHGGF